MDAVEFFKTVNRLCKNQKCEECPVYKNDMCCMVGFDDESVKSIEETVSKVEQWAKGHPVKTRQSEFLKMFPNAPLLSRRCKYTAMQYRKRNARKLFDEKLL